LQSFWLKDLPEKSKLNFIYFLGGQLKVFRKNIIFLLAFMMLLGFTNSVLAVRGTAEVTITPAKDAFAAEDSVLVNVSVTNPNKNTIRILRWYTPAQN
jgi:hypothetical protein